MSNNWQQPKVFPSKQHLPHSSPAKTLPAHRAHLVRQLQLRRAAGQKRCSQPEPADGEPVGSVHGAAPGFVMVEDRCPGRPSVDSRHEVSGYGSARRGPPALSHADRGGSRRSVGAPCGGGPRQCGGPPKPAVGFGGPFVAARRPQGPRH